jgi:hypothetical protein
MEVGVPNDRVMFTQPPIQRVRVGENVRFKKLIKAKARIERGRSGT